MSKRPTHSAEFGSRVAMEAINGSMTMQKIAVDHVIHSIRVTQWKKQLLDDACELLARGKQRKEKEEGQAKEAELFLQIEKLQMELEWLKKISVALAPMNCASWSIQTTLSSVSAAYVSC